MRLRCIKADVSEYVVTFRHSLASTISTFSRCGNSELFELVFLLGNDVSQDLRTSLLGGDLASQAVHVFIDSMTMSRVSTDVCSVTALLIVGVSSRVHIMLAFTKYRYLAPYMAR